LAGIAAGEASYRPVATLSYYIIHKAAGQNPFYYHLVSVVLHILNTLLVYWTARLVLRNPSAALIAGLLFACHPAQTEAVDCISYNEDLLACFFFLAAFIFYLKATPEDSKKTVFMFYIGSLVCFLLGLLSKEMAITLPAVLLLYDLTLRARDRKSLSPALILKTVKARVRLYAGYAAVSMFYLTLRFVLLTSPVKEAKPFYGSLVERVSARSCFQLYKAGGFPARSKRRLRIFIPLRLFRHIQSRRLYCGRGAGRCQLLYL